MHEANIEANIAEFYEAWNRGDRDAVLPKIAPNAIDHNSTTGETGAESLMKSFMELRAAFPDLKYTVHELAIDPKRQLSSVVATCDGTHEGAYLDIPPSRRPLSWREMRMTRWHEGRAVEHWTVSELLAVLRRP